MNQSNHHFNFTIPLNTTKAKAWQTLIDVEHWHKWDTELIQAKLEGIFENGAKGTMKPKTGPVLHFFISDFVPHQSYTINTKMPVGQLIIKRSLTESNNQIFFTDEIMFVGFLKYVFGIILGGQFRKVLPQVMLQFKQIAEAK
jgi:hypothetical protein